MSGEAAGAALGSRRESLDVGRSATLPDCGILVRGTAGKGLSIFHMSFSIFQFSFCWIITYLDSPESCSWEGWQTGQHTQLK